MLSLPLARTPEAQLAAGQSLTGINSRITEAEEWISDLEDRMVEFTAAEQNKKKKE